MQEILNKKEYNLTKTQEIIQAILIALGLFLVPLFIPSILQSLLGNTSFLASNSQLIVGSIVNAGLILTAMSIGGIKRLLLFASIPSISAMTGGYIFGPLSAVTIYMLPAIWLGNLSLILLVKYFCVGKKSGYVVSMIISGLIKVTIIFGILNLLMAIALIPSNGVIANTLKYSFGVVQLITITVGAIIVRVTVNLLSKHNSTVSSKD